MEARAMSADVSTVGTSPALLRRINSRAVLAELVDAGAGSAPVDRSAPVDASAPADVSVPADAPRASRTVTELVGSVGLSRPTVEAALADLVAEGWVAEVDAVATPNRAGRRARRFAVDARAGSVLGLDLGLHAVVGVVADLSGTPIARIERDHRDLGPAEAAWDTVRDVVAELTDAVPEGRLLAVTVGLPAIVDRAGRIVHTAAVPDWITGHLLDRVAGLFPDATTVFDNDAKLAATAETMWGRFRQVRDGLALVMGRQIGAALLVEGRVARGAHGAAGEIGGLGTTGWPSAASRLEARLPSDADLTAVMRAARDGDAEATATVQALAADVAPGVALLVAAVDPEVVVVGGEVLPAAEVFCAALAAELERAGTPVAVEPSGIGRDAVVRGALARSLTRARTEHLGIR
jgi:predicted NBD/HSP70 family sugar kinase